MWDFPSLIGKAELYLQRAQEHPSQDEEFALWSLLGLEFLIRAPLAQVSPALLAAPDGDSILHAVDVGIQGEPKSIPAATVLRRLQHVITDFGKEREVDTLFLLGLRNAELHTGSAVLATTTTEDWLPPFIRVAEVICGHLGMLVDDLVGEEVANLGRELVDAQDKRLEQMVRTRIDSAKDFYQHLKPEEVTARVLNQPSKGNLTHELISCPACSQKAAVTLRRGRTLSERHDGNEFVSQVILVAQHLQCSACGLILEGPAEFKAAKLQQQYAKEERADVLDRLAYQYIDDDYGND